MGRSDLRKINFSVKMGLALTFVSLLIYLKEPLNGLSRYSVWAILTVVVVFEFNIDSNLPGLGLPILPWLPNRTAVESTSQEDALLGFAIWEPPHGPYRQFRYPWKGYVRVSGVLRHCAFMVMALHGCILSEIQAPLRRDKVFFNELHSVGVEGAKVLREHGYKVKTMEKLGPVDMLFEVHEATEGLQRKIDQKSYLLRNLACKSYSAILNFHSVPSGGSWDHARPCPPSPHSLEDVDPSLEVLKLQSPYSTGTKFINGRAVEESKTYESASALSLTTFASLLIEFVARLQNLVGAFEELSVKAKFKEPSIRPNAEQESFTSGIFHLGCQMKSRGENPISADPHWKVWNKSGTTTTTWCVGTWNNLANSRTHLINGWLAGIKTANGHFFAWDLEGICTRHDIIAKSIPLEVSHLLYVKSMYEHQIR
ncbi:hypothetical protein SAY86_016459 [Trapa natans]|uniref:Aluminum-activated malate transporter n=1 Tax=Trapa natans TaxID=22666 RepID=A0AAN7QX68_TRANT|nr:hypothetical protein SAY86_016459 [Trapa natans]